ncbi:MAG: hypothetical protein HY847_06985 [Betaproteobacteria bacterium]|nr:hypothetical protein [Betaproteobacteria bacterium]
MKNPDLLVNAIGIVYGLLLIYAAFFESKFTEALRIDVLFMKDASPRTRPANLIVGVLVAGYATYALLPK